MSCGVLVADCSGVVQDTTRALEPQRLRRGVHGGCWRAGICLMRCSAFVQVPPARFSGTAGGFTETLRREGIVPFQSLLVVGRAWLLDPQRGKLPAGALDDRS